MTGDLTILLGFAIGWSLLYCIFVGTLVEAAISPIVGASLLRGHLRLPANQELADLRPPAAPHFNLIAAP